MKQIDYRKLMNNPKIKCNVVFNKNGKINEELSDPMIVKYCELNQKYHFKINMESIDVLRDGQMSSSQLKQELLFDKIAHEIKFELSQFGYNESEITDILVKFLYHVKPSKHKAALWFCYGKYIVENLKKNGCGLKTKIVQCVDCGEWFEINKSERHIRCNECAANERKRIEREKKRKQRSK